MNRHRWKRETSHGSRCVRCGLYRLKIPHPYEGRWFTEWSWTDEDGVRQYATQEKVPFECVDAEITRMRPAGEQVTT